ncbi:DNA-binding protein [Betaproteobacteria bacterium]|nr:DNA-binding protein [Betaproteobacteria bacterium]
MNSKQAVAPLQSLIGSHIVVLRGQRVMLDTDLAELYGVPTKALNQAVKRNKERFPADFMFQLTTEEKQEVVTNCDHLAKLKFSRSLPFAFTEHGAIQASNVLASPQAVEMGVYVVRAFVSLREILTSNRELALRLQLIDQFGVGEKEIILTLLDAMIAKYSMEATARTLNDAG